MDTSPSFRRPAILETRFHSARASWWRTNRNDRQFETVQARRLEKSAGARLAKASTPTAWRWSRRAKQTSRLSARVEPTLLAVVAARTRAGASVQPAPVGRPEPPLSV